MSRVVKVSFKKHGMQYYFSAGELKLKKSDKVIVETERGIQFATIETDIFVIDDNKLTSPLKEIVRIATKKDIDQNRRNIEDAKLALKKCRELVKKHQLNMKVLDATYTFDRDQLMFHFLADNRIDFRSLAKELASIYRTRIELRQVGVRDKAKEIGGIGLCGRCLCCSTFLYDFDSVSINMAKNQNISLNPSKINGLCGRLLCCLNYEDECYKECRKNLPSVGKKVQTEYGEGIVKEVDVLKQKYKVNVQGKGIVELEVK